jgi:hypothetical protein
MNRSKRKCRKQNYKVSDKLPQSSISPKINLNFSNSLSLRITHVADTATQKQLSNPIPFSSAAIAKAPHATYIRIASWSGYSREAIYVKSKERESFMLSLKSSSVNFVITFSTFPNSGKKYTTIK